MFGSVRLQRCCIGAEFDVVFGSYTYRLNALDTMIVLVLRISRTLLVRRAIMIIGKFPLPAGLENGSVAT